MGDLMSATEVLARLRIDAASEDFEGAQLGPVAVRKLLKHIAALESDRWRQLCRIHSNRADALRRERDEARRDRDMLRLCMNDGACRALVSERDQLAARLAEIERAADLDVDIIEAQRAVVQQLASRPVCNWAGQCRHQRQATADAPELAEPADPRTPPPGCRLLGDYEPAQAGDMAYIGAIGGRWRRVRPRMGIIGATMDELSDGARVLALARPCRCGPDSRSDSTSCPRGVMTISVYYFCAEYRDDQLTHSMSGTIQSDMPPFHEDFHARLTERIAANMKPPRPADLVSVRSLSLLATREVEHGDVWARQSGRDDGGHAEHDGADADAERAYCAAAVGACGRASHE